MQLMRGQPRQLSVTICERLTYGFLDRIVRMYGKSQPRYKSDEETVSKAV